jgi:hypothetical protein
LANLFFPYKTFVCLGTKKSHALHKKRRDWIMVKGAKISKKKTNISFDNERHIDAKSSFGFELKNEHYPKPI